MKVRFTQFHFYEFILEYSKEKDSSYLRFLGGGVGTSNSFQLEIKLNTE